MILTYIDVIEHLVDYLGGNLHDATQREIRRAAISAYRELIDCYPWRSLHKLLAIPLNATHTAGTVSYDHCVTPEHEALTRDGWKTYDKLAVGDEILAYDHFSEACSWQVVEKLHVSEYTGKILDVKRKGRSVLRCTPNHKVPVVFRGGDGRTSQIKGWVLAKDLTSEHATPLSAPLDVLSSGELDARLAAILGWVVTDGSGLKYGPSKPVIIAQSVSANPAKCEILRDLIGRNHRGVRPDGGTSFNVKPEDKHAIRSAASNKNALMAAFTRLGVIEAASAATAMSLAESSTNANGQKVFSQWGDNKPVAEAFQVACILHGKATNLSERPFKTPGGIKTRYQCPVRTGNHIRLAKQSAWVDYSGTVWCPQVRTGAWVVRCNGAVMITGNSGGSSERLWTFSSATLPTWAARGQLYVGVNSWPIQRRLSSSTLQSPADFNPGSDVSSTTFELYQNEFLLPADFRSIHVGMPMTRAETTAIDLPSLFWQNRQNGASGSPGNQNVVADRFIPGRQALVLNPWPSEADTYMALYRYRPRELIYTGLSERDRGGTVTLSGTTITGNGTAFEAGHEGAIIRISRNATKYPTDQAGDNPCIFEGVIDSVSDSSTLTVLSNANSTTATSCKYTITDPIALPESMLNAYLRCCEKQSEIIRQRDDGGKQSAMMLYADALETAMVADRKTFEVISLIENSGLNSPNWMFNVQRLPDDEG